MKIYITAKFKATENKDDIESLCSAVKNSGFEDFCFIRDVENYQKIFYDMKELWQKAKEEIEKCDVLLIDATESPSGGRVIEAGIAYGLGIPTITIVKNDIEYNPHYDGISTKIIKYNSYEDIIEPLNDFLINQN